MARIHSVDPTGASSERGNCATEEGDLLPGAKPRRSASDGVPEPSCTQVSIYPGQVDKTGPKCELAAVEHSGEAAAVHLHMTGSHQA